MSWWFGFFWGEDGVIMCFIMYIFRPGEKQQQIVKRGQMLEAEAKR